MNIHFMFSLFSKKEKAPEASLVGPGRKQEMDRIQNFVKKAKANGLRFMKDNTQPQITQVADDGSDHEEETAEDAEMDYPEFPYCYSKCCHAFVLPLTFICDAIRWSKLDLKGTHNPMELKISAYDIRRVWSHVFETRERSYHLVPQCVRTVSYTSLGVPIELAYKLVTHVPTTQNEKASWTHTTTVASGVEWSIPDGRIAPEQSCAQVCHTTWEADPQLLADEDFLRMKSFTDDDMQVQSWLRDNETRVHVPGPDSITTRQDGVAWSLGPKLLEWKEEYAPEEDAEESDEVDAVVLPIQPVRDYVDSLRNKVNSKKNLMSLDQGITMEIYPVHPAGWGAWMSRRQVAQTSNTIIDPRAKDPFMSLSVTVELVAIPILAQPNRDGVQTGSVHTLGQVPRTNLMWRE